MRQKWSIYLIDLIVTTDQPDRKLVVQLKDTTYPFSGNELLKFIVRIRALEKRQPNSQYIGAVY